MPSPRVSLRFPRCFRFQWWLMGLLLAGPVLARDLVFQPVAEGVFAYIGDTGGRSYENDAINANLGLVVTNDGALLIDSGASYLGAQKVAEAARKVTSQPIRWVINSGNQDQRWLGNAYFRDKGAEILAHAAGRAYMQEAGGQMVARLRPILKDKLRGTVPTLPSRWLEGPDNTLTLGGTVVHILHRGGGHTPGDIIVWLPGQHVAFAGDVVYVERMLGMNPVSRTRPWLDSFAALEALEPRIVIPGHGGPTTLVQARQDTRDLLRALRQHMGKAVENMQDMDSAVKSFDPQPFRYLLHADVWLPQLANRTYLDMEKE
jgi:glyoxylase-like metal-dependent hydrolase (beta-lactamase superfamily II)